MKHNIVFMGTPAIGAKILASLLKLDVNVVAVVTQPDKKVGRKQRIQYSEVKTLALAHDLVVFQPYDGAQLYEMLKKESIDAIVTCAYGMFLPQKVLDLAQKIALNVHASLLPHYRGGAPVQYAIKNNETYSGITLMEMVKKMDAGDMYAQEKLRIAFDDTTTSLMDKLGDLGQKMIEEHLFPILKGELKGRAQDETAVSFAPIITAADERIKMQAPGLMIYKQIQALLETPGGYVMIQDQKVKVHESHFEAQAHDYPCNHIIDFNKNACEVAVADGILKIQRLQLPGKKIMDAAQVYHNLAGQWVGKEVS